MFYTNSNIGTKAGDVFVIDSKLRNHHGKKSMVVIWRYRYTSSHAVKLNESPVFLLNGKPAFLYGSERKIAYVPKQFIDRYTKEVKEKVL